MTDTKTLMIRRKRLINQISQSFDFLIGSVSSKGLKCEAYNLTTKVDGVTKSKHIPKDLVPAVRELTQRHKEVKKLIKELGRTNWLLFRKGIVLKGDGTE